MQARIVLVLCLAALACAARIPDGSKEISAPTHLSVIIKQPCTPLAASAVFEPNCFIYNLPMCTREYNPVCGTDKNTYPNECTLCLDNIELKRNVLISRNGEC